ncbi:MAG: tetratricopeptide repeat protein [Alphaproteobacteria bacterium]
MRLTDALATPDTSEQSEYATVKQVYNGKRQKVDLATLQAAADRNFFHAQLQLGRIYNEGKLVAQNKVKACELFEAAVIGHTGYDKTHPQAKAMGEATRLLGLCYLEGASSGKWKSDPERAAALFLKAGATFEDPSALFELAQLYLQGKGARYNPRLAVNYLYSAARKQYAPAQALLGHMKWEGKLMKRRSTEGLALLIMAKDANNPINSPHKYRAWINRQYEDAKLTASHSQEYESKARARTWKKAYGVINSRPLNATNSITPANEKPASEENASPSSVTVTKEDDGLVPMPVKAPWHQEQDQFNNLETGADVPESASPVKP